MDTGLKRCNKKTGENMKRIVSKSVQQFMEKISEHNTSVLQYKCIKHSLEHRPRQCSQYSNLLQVGRSRDSSLLGVRLSSSIQTGPGVHPASCKVGNQVSLPGVEQPGSGTDHPPPTSTKVKERMELYLHSPSGLLWPILGWTSFT
jgi:hypothetical protein